jgi:glycosyltransferase involved in cell wall biosynthesis
LVRSLLSVDYPEDLFEVLVVDDGSTVPISASDLKKGPIIDMHIHILRFDKNRGVAPSLNLALEYLSKRTDFKYIARLDCGDLCVNDRFSKQVQFLNNHPEIGLSGSQVMFRAFGSGKEYRYENKIEHRDIVKEMHHKCSFIHPSVMFRREILGKVGLYPENYLHCEDYAFFFKIIKLYISYNIPEILLVSEINDNGISARFRKKQIISRMRIVNDFGSDAMLKASGLLRLLILLLIPLRITRYLNTLKR